MDDGLKQRLVGAIVLVAIAVLFLPSLFERDSRLTVDLSSEIPREPPVTTRMLEVQEPERPKDIPPAKPLAENYPHQEAPDASAEPDGSEQAQALETADTEVETQQNSESSESPPEPDPQQEQSATTAPELNAEGVPNAWSLQVGSFGSGERALALQQRLQDAGYKSYIREGIGTQGIVYRVFVGPKINKATAQAEKQTIDEQFNTSALIVEFKP